jgi:thiol peroxidase
MARITLKGNPINTSGTLPAKGRPAPDFTLTGGDLADVSLASFAGRKKILNIVPSLDTSVCALSAKRFNEAVAALGDTMVLNISADLPFAQKRFCDAEKLASIIPLSTFQSPSFGRDYGVLILDKPLAGLMSRAVVVLDTNNIVVYTEQVPEIAQEPDYSAALAAVRSV